MTSYTIYMYRVKNLAIEIKVKCHGESFEHCKTENRADNFSNETSESLCN